MTYIRSCFYTETTKRFGLPNTTDAIVVINVKKEYTKKHYVLVVLTFSSVFF